MPTITSSGVGSGLNVTSLVSQLVAAERAPYDSRLVRADAKLTSEFSALAQLKGSMSGLQTSLAGFKKPEDFLTRKVTASTPDYFQATATSAAAVGTYSIEVRRLATAAQLGSAAIVGGATAVVGTGTLTIAMGVDSFNVVLAPGTDTLGALRDAINSSVDNPGVNAGLVNDIDGTHLVLTGTKTGAVNALRVTATGGNGGMAQFVYDPPTTTNLDPLTSAQDAIVFVSGFEVHDADNTVSDAIEGVTLNLKKEETGKVTTLTVAVDNVGIRDKANNFVKSYNALSEQIAKLRSYNAETKVAGPLLGDAMLRNMESQLRRILTEPVAGATETYATLASLGITTSVSGALTLDATRFDAAMVKDPSAVSKLFSSESGVAVKLRDYLEDRLASDGDIAGRDARITSRRKDLVKQQAALEVRMTQIQTRYLKQFNGLDSLLTRMQSTSTYLAQQLTSVSSSR